MAIALKNLLAPSPKTGFSKRVTRNRGGASRKVGAFSAYRRENGLSWAARSRSSWKVLPGSNSTEKVPRASGYAVGEAKSAAIADAKPTEDRLRT